MRKIVFLLLAAASLVAQSPVEQKVLQSVRQMAQREGRVTFSDLYNNPDFTAQEKAFLGHLYETFFQIPELLKSEYEGSGDTPSRQRIADALGLSILSVDLLLTVMESDSRVPPLFKRDAESREITALNLENIAAFIAHRGSEVKLTQWQGTSLPAFELPSFDGERVSQNDLSGKSSLIYFWFTGCPPCVRIAPILADLDRDYSQSGFDVVGFNADRILGLTTTDQERRDYLQKNNLGFTNLHLDQATREAFGNVNVFPTLFFVNREGLVAQHAVNFQDRPALEEIVEKLLVEN